MLGAAHLVGERPPLRSVSRADARSCCSSSRAAGSMSTGLSVAQGGSVASFHGDRGASQPWDSFTVDSGGGGGGASAAGWALACTSYRASTGSLLIDARKSGRGVPCLEGGGMAVGTVEGRIDSSAAKTACSSTVFGLSAGGMLSGGGLAPETDTGREGAAAAGVASESSCGVAARPPARLGAGVPRGVPRGVGSGADWRTDEAGAVRGGGPAAARSDLAGEPGTVKAAAVSDGLREPCLDTARDSARVLGRGALAAR